MKQFWIILVCFTFIWACGVQQQSYQAKATGKLFKMNPWLQIGFCFIAFLATIYCFTARFDFGELLKSFRG